MNYSALREACYQANREIVDAGLVLLTWGNTSVLSDSGTSFAIKPSGVRYSELSADKMVLVDIESGGVVEGALRPSSDTPTHLELYRAFAGIKAVVHTHSHFAVVFAQAPAEIPIFGTTHADHFRESIPLARGMTMEEVDGDYEAATGRVIVECFAKGGVSPEDVPGVLVAHHGPFAWGKSAKAAVENAIVLEECARMALHTTLLRSAISTSSAGNQQRGRTASQTPAADIGDGAPRYLTERHFLRKHGSDAYYGQK